MVENEATSSSLPAMWTFAGATTEVGDMRVSKARIGSPHCGPPGQQGVGGEGGDGGCAGSSSRRRTELGDGSSRPTKGFVRESMRSVRAVAEKPVAIGIWESIAPTTTITTKPIGLPAAALGHWAACLLGNEDETIREIGSRTHDPSPVISALAVRRLAQVLALTAKV